MRKTVIVLVLTAVLAVCLFGPAGASQSTYHVYRTPDPGAVTLGPGGAMVFQRYLLLGITAVHTDSVLTPHFYFTSTKDTLHLGTAVRSVTVSSAVLSDSLLKGGICARTIRYCLDTGNSANDVNAGYLAFFGTNAVKDTISEYIAITDNTPKQGQTSKAFASLTKVKLPPGATKTPYLEIGRGYRIGLPFTTALDQPAAAGPGTILAWWKTGTAQALPIADSLFISATAIASNNLGLALITAPTTYDFLFFVPPYQGTTARTKW